jgi:hypothetical protein
MPQATPVFQTLSGSNAPFKAMKLRTELKGDLHDMAFDNIRLVLDMGAQNLPIEGRLSFLSKDKPTFEGNFTLKHLQADHLMASQDAAPKVPMMLLASLKSPPFQKEKSPSSHEGWSSKPVVIDFLNAFNMNVGIKINRLSYKDWVVDLFSGRLKVIDGTAQLDEGKGTCFGGALQIEGAIAAQKTPVLKVIASLKDAHLQRLAPKESGRFKLTQGKLNTFASLSSQGRSVYEWVGGLKGKVSLQAHKGVVQGVDLKAVSQKLKNLKNLTGFVDLMATAFSKGSTSFDSLEGALEFTKGRGVLNTVLLKADSGEGRATGILDLPTYTMAVDGVFVLADLPEYPPLKVSLTGALDDPKTHFDTKALEEYLLKNVFKNLLRQGDLKDSLEGVLSGLLGKSPDKQENKDQGTAKESSPSPKEPPPPQGSVEPNLGDIIKKPEKALENVLKGLF